ncbi:hypothetical protein PHYC_00295 [Phycisphaerales bacterium]|nr:hypothetical protein PHYC_00295 [Phycisphaerales bacterium]
MRLLPVFVCVMGLVESARCLAQCESWVRTAANSALSNAYDLTYMDWDGSGPGSAVLYAAQAATTNSPAVHWWDGYTWIPVPPTRGHVRDLHVIPSQHAGLPAPRLVLGGRFTSADGTCRHIASWDGAVLAPIGPSTESDFSTNATVYSVTSWDSDGPGPVEPWIVAGGWFYRFGGTTARDVAAWDGVQWRALDGLSGSGVHALISWDPDSGGSQLPMLVAVVPTLPSVMRWNGSTWQPLGSAFDGPVYAITLHDEDGQGPIGPTLVVSGDFQNNGGMSVPQAARWSGSEWQPLASGPPPFVPQRVFSVDLDQEGPSPPSLICGGTSGAGTSFIARLEDGQWIGWPGFLTSVQQAMSVAILDPDGGGGPRGNEVVAGGAITNGISSWDGARWRKLGDEFNGKIGSFLWFDEDGEGPTPLRLYASGMFSEVGGGPANGLARWEDDHWVGLGTPPPGGVGLVMKLDSFDPDGGGPESPWLVGTPGSSLNNGPVRWNGSSWIQIGIGSGSAVTIRAHDEDGPGPQSSRLFATGNGLRVLEGSTWIRAGLPRSVNYWPLISHDPDGLGTLLPRLVAAGVGPNGDLVEWNGTDWNRLSAVAVDQYYIWHLRSWDSDGDGPARPEILVGGRNITAPDGVFHGVAAFADAAWRQVGSTILPDVRGMGDHDPDGNGPVVSQLLIGYSGHDGKGVARLQAGDWASLGAGLSGPAVVAHAFVDVDPDGPGPLPVELWVGGQFTHAGGQPALNFARWRMNSLPPAIAVHPTPMAVIAGGVAEFSLMAQAQQAMTYQWRRGSQSLLDGPAPGGGVIEGSTTATLRISGVALADAGEYVCVVSTPCQSVASTPARLRVCDPDVNCDGSISGFDVQATEEAVNGDFTNFCQSSADLNGDGTENGFDIEVEEQRVNGAPC